METIQHNAWQHFQQVNASRRAIRDYTDTPVPDKDMKDILQAAMLAPSSANGQPYQLHWVKDPTIKAKVAKACNNQKAAVTAPYLVVLVAGRKITKQSIKSHIAWINNTDQLSEASRAYHQNSMKKMRGFMQFGGLAIWSPILWVFRQLLPVLTLFPFSPAGMRHWMARSSIYAAQNLMLATTAKGYATCPMEGFNALAVAKALKLPYGATVPLVIAIGQPAADARVDVQWRRKMEEVVVVH